MKISSIFHLTLSKSLSLTRTYTRAPAHTLSRTISSRLKQALLHTHQPTESKHVDGVSNCDLIANAVGRSMYQAQKLACLKIGW